MPIDLGNVHVALVFVAFGVIFFADHEVFGWVRGTKPTLSPSRMRYIHHATWATLLSLIATGTLLLLPQASDLLSQPLFIMKLLFVAILIVNAILIGRLVPLTLTRTFASLTWEERLPLFTSGAVSVFSWVSIVIIALAVFGL